ncbi:glutathione transferase GstA [Kaistia terrae]|jgi:glutathione S-transferase|uniref:Glutathione transferase GstA n=1 Tax=Kaistia terrae TaxID=537017 RepID=A0ABW0PU99_9HYPH|nr:glutathione transferase GstA [Kaistia terrae]MCX5576791.1 glutathione transferase GstA [Kaistia terrae]
MKLFYAPGACSLSPHIALREAGLPFDIVKVDLRDKATESGGDFKAINPKGYVPALELEDGSIVTEGPVIVQMIADLVPKSGLAPAFGTRERYQLMDWLAFISTELHKGFSPLFNPATNEEAKKSVKERLTLRFAYLTEALGDKPYLMGENFSVADGYLFTVLRWAKSFKFDVGSKLDAYFDRVAARPAVQQALEAEGLRAAA